MENFNTAAPTPEELTPEELATHKELEAKLAEKEGGTVYEEGIVIPMHKPTLEELHEKILDPMTTDEDRMMFQEQVNEIEEELGLEEGKTGDSIAA
jgi:hypothetical protein